MLCNVSGTHGQETLALTVRILHTRCRNSPSRLSCLGNERYFQRVDGTCEQCELLNEREGCGEGEMWELRERREGGK